MRIRANHFQSDFMRGEAYGLSGFLIYTQISSMEESMIHRQKCNSQSGFMSVEAVATTLFYLIMVGVITLIASQIMNTGKMATTYNALSMLRVNVQYVGTNVGNYSSIYAVKLDNLVSGLLTNAVAGTTANEPSKAVLPIGKKLEVIQAAATDVDESGTPLGADRAPAYFKMTIVDTSVDECRKLAYYGLGGGYGLTMTSAPAAITSAADIESKCSAAPSGSATSLDVTLTSK